MDEQLRRKLNVDQTDIEVLHTSIWGYSVKQDIEREISTARCENDIVKNPWHEHKKNDRRDDNRHDNPDQNPPEVIEVIPECHLLI